MRKIDRPGTRDPTHVPQAEAEEKQQSTHGHGKIRDYVHKLLVLSLQHNNRKSFFYTFSEKLSALSLPPWNRSLVLKRVTGLNFSPDGKQNRERQYRRSNGTDQEDM